MQRSTYPGLVLGVSAKVTVAVLLVSQLRWIGGKEHVKCTIVIAVIVVVFVTGVAVVIAFVDRLHAAPGSFVVNQCEGSVKFLPD